MHSKFLPSMHKTAVPTRNCETVANPVKSRRYSNNLDNSLSHTEVSFPVRSSVCVLTCAKRKKKALHCLDIQMLSYSLSLTLTDWRLDSLGFLQYKCVAKWLFLDCLFFSRSRKAHIAHKLMLVTNCSKSPHSKLFFSCEITRTSHLYGDRNSSSTPVSYYIWFEEKGTASDRHNDWLYDNVHEQYR